MNAPVPLPIRGGCGCGTVRFEIDEPLVVAMHCHCTRCQRRSGTAGPVSARIVPGSFRLVSGADEVRGWFAGDGMEKVFCSACGSAIFVRTPDTHEVVAVRMGAIDGDPGIRPTVRQFLDYVAPWESIPDDGLLRFAGRAPAHIPESL